MKSLVFFCVAALAVTGVAHGAASPYRYVVVSAGSSGASTSLALNFARGQAASLCRSRFRGTLIGFPRSSVVRRGSLYSASVSSTCQIPA